MKGTFLPADVAIYALKNCPIVLSTLGGSAKISCNDNMDDNFDFIIIDEAAQATEPESLLPIGHTLKSTGRLILAGDIFQLRPFVFSQKAKHKNYDKSLMERLQLENDLYKHKANGGFDEKHVTMLNINYRSHDAIVSLSSSIFYHNRLQCHAHQNTKLLFRGCNFLQNREFPVIFHECNTPEEYVASSYRNTKQCEIAANYLRSISLYKNHLKQRGLTQLTKGLICPYRRQNKHMRMLYSNELTDVKTGSVEEFQGQEKNVIIVTTTRCTPQPWNMQGGNPIGFLNDENRLNVMLTRATSLLIVIGCSQTLSTNRTWYNFINYVRANGGYQTGTEVPTYREDQIVRIPLRSYQQVTMEVQQNQRPFDMSDMSQQLNNIVEPMTNNHYDANGQLIGQSYGYPQGLHMHPNMQQNNRVPPGMGPNNALSQRMVIQQTGRFSPMVGPNNGYPQSPRNNGYSQHLHYPISQNQLVRGVRGNYPPSNIYQPNSHEAVKHTFSTAGQINANKQFATLVRGQINLRQDERITNQENITKDLTSNGGNQVLPGTKLAKSEIDQLNTQDFPPLNQNNNSALNELIKKAKNGFESSQPEQQCYVRNSENSLPFAALDCCRNVLSSPLREVPEIEIRNSNLPGVQEVPTMQEHGAIRTPYMGVEGVNYASLYNNYYQVDNGSTGDNINGGQVFEPCHDCGSVHCRCHIK